MKIVILGTGFVSQAYQRALGSLGYDPLILSRSFCNYKDSEAFKAFIKSNKPNYVINCSGFTGSTVDECESKRDECYWANLVVPYHVSLWCHEYGVKLIHISSGCIFDGAGPFTEESKPDPQSYYAECKMHAEGFGKGRDVWQFRIRMPFSHIPHRRNWLTKLIDYHHILDGLNSVTWIDEFAMRSWQIANKAEPGIYNATQPDPVTTLTVAQKLNAAGLRGVPELLDEITFNKTHVKRSAAVLDCSKFEKAYGTPSTPSLSALRWCIDQMKSG